MAAGLQQAFRSESMSKPLHAGHAAEAGLLAAKAAGVGLTGALDVLEGEVGFGAGMSDHPDWEAATVDLGNHFCIVDATVKSHSCCGHTFAALDAMSDLRRSGLLPEDVAGIKVATYGTALNVAGNPDPSSVFEAKFSLPYCVAAELVLGAVRLQAFEPEALGDPVIRRLVAATTLEVDADFDAWFPGKRAARVTVTDHQGQQHQSSRQTRKGDPDDPLTDEEMQAKFDELVVPRYGTAGAATLAERIWGLADLADVRHLDPGQLQGGWAARATAGTGAVGVNG
jgi:2-methylcitrate dehydratase PrpD